MSGVIPDKYASIDSELDSWAQANGVNWYKQHHDESVRSLDYPNSGNRLVQLYVEPPTGTRFRVFAGRTYLRGSQRLEVTDRDLHTALDKALTQAKQWIAQQ